MLADTALDAGERFVSEVEAILSRFQADSELSRLNARTGQWVSVSPILSEVLAVALRAARRTGGLCTPTILAVLEEAGYDRDFAALSSMGMAALGRRDTLPDRPASADLAPCRRGRTTSGLSTGASHVRGRRLRMAKSPLPPTRAWRAIRTDTKGRVRLPSGVRIDLAGVAKGWTADRVADILAERGPCLVDAGGDLAARGRPAGLIGWPIAISNPRDVDRDLAMVMLADAGVATSGVDFRRWKHSSSDAHHLIDPRTGGPSTTDVLTATVIGPTVAEADVYAKVALLHGASAGRSYLLSHGLAGLIVRQDGTVITTPRWRQFTYATYHPAD